MWLDNALPGTVSDGLVEKHNAHGACHHFCKACCHLLKSHDTQSASSGEYCEIFLKKLMMVFIPGNALGGGFSWICAPLAPPQWGLILVKPCPSGFMLHLVHFKPFIFRTQERVTCLTLLRRAHVCNFKRGGERVHQRSRWQLCVCVLLTVVGSVVSKTLKKR